MEDYCAVCADSLEWVAYGFCGHRDVCSTCIVRLRYVLSDRRCCICKTECPTVFITRALGSFTETKVNFSEFPPGVTEGQNGKYWYHEDSQAFFDDLDHYRLISSTCRLSCSICDNNVGELRRDNSNRNHKFKNIEQLKGHLYHHHRMFMCGLCLEGRKVFISEQKLYSRSQLRQHVSTGDSEVDGSESERGGFKGHSMCEFCKNPFYGDTELYLHMSTEHFTCHICQRQRPGQYDYYRNYEDLETHFHHEHFLCESEACMAKKFVVFQTDAEMKRHNAIEHGGHMSRAKRNAALQIPISFRYRRNEQEQRRGGRRHELHPETSNNQLTMAIQASLETALAEGRFRESSSGSRLHAEDGETSQAHEIISSMEPLAISSVSEPLSSRSIAANRHSSVNESILEEISFPPLSAEPPRPSSRYAHAVNQRSRERFEEESFPPLREVKGSSKPMPGHVSKGIGADACINHRNKGPMKIMKSVQHRPHENCEAGTSTPSGSSQQNPQPATSTSSYAKPWVALNQVNPSSSSASQTTQLDPSSSSASQATRIGENGFASTIPRNSAWKPKNMRMKPSASATNLHNSGPSNMEDVHRANTCLVESIRAGLGMDVDKYAAFRSFSVEYRQNLINSMEYLSYVKQFGLSHLVPELAKHCLDPQKQKELIDAYKDAKKGKGKTSQHSSDHEVEMLTKEGIERSSNPSYMKSNVGDNTKTITNHSSGGEGIKKNKKTSKFHRVRLGDGSAATYLDLSRQQTSSLEEENRSKTANLLPARGVWGKGSVHKLFTKTGTSK